MALDPAYKNVRRLLAKHPEFKGFQDEEIARQTHHITRCAASVRSTPVRALTRRSQVQNHQRAHGGRRHGHLVPRSPDRPPARRHQRGILEHKVHRRFMSFLDEIFQRGVYRRVVRSDAPRAPVTAPSACRAGSPPAWRSASCL